MIILRGYHKISKNNLIYIIIRDTDDSRNHNSFAPLSKYSIKCYRCNHFGHMEWDYPIRSRELFFILVMFSQNNQSKWFTNSNFSRHMTRDQNNCITLKEGICKDHWKWYLKPS